MSNATDSKVERPQTHNVFTVVDREGGGRSFWAKIGRGYTNRDGSISIELDALPVNGRIHVRVVEESKPTLPY
jgi:hypothetical protein